VKGWKKIYQALKTSRSSNTYLVESKLQITLIKKDKEGHSILTEGEIHPKEITIINLYAPNFIKHTLKDIKTYIDSNTVIVGEFNTTLSLIDRSSKQKNQ
jgi:hypothetical protein